MSYKLVLCSSGFSVDSWKIYTWLEKYNTFFYDIPVVLLYDITSLEMHQLWDKEKIEVKELFQISNMIDSDTDIFDSLRLTFIKMLAYRYCGNCIVCDLNFIPSSRLKIEDIPPAKWAAISQHELVNGINQPWHNIVYQKFSEFSYVEQLLMSPHIFTFDAFESFFSLWNKYKDQFFDIYYYPRLVDSIFSLTHKVSNGTFLSSSWCSNWNENRKTYFKHYSSNDAFDQELKKMMTIPGIQINE